MYKLLRLIKTECYMGCKQNVNVYFCTFCVLFRTQKRMLIKGMEGMKNEMAARARAKSLFIEDGLTKQKFCEITGFSEAQFYRWYGNGKSAGKPTMLQANHIVRCFDWSPSYIEFGAGPKHIKDLVILSAGGSKRAIARRMLHSLSKRQKAVVQSMVTRLTEKKSRSERKQYQIESPIESPS